MFTPPLPVGYRNALDPRLNRQNGNQRHHRFTQSPSYMPSTPSSSSGYHSMPASPYVCVPSTPRSPFDHHNGHSHGYNPYNGRKNNNDLLDPDTFEIRNYKHPGFVANFYESFKTFPPEFITPQVHQNCVTVLKHVIHQLNEQKHFCRNERDQLRHELTRKEQEMHGYLMNDNRINQEDVNKMMDEISRLTAENQNLLKEKTADKERYNTLMKECRKLAGANEQFAKKVQEMDTLGKNLDKMRLANEKLRNEKEDDKSTIIKLKRDIQLSEYNNIGLKENIANLTDTNKRLQIEAEKRAQESDEKVEAVAELTEDFQSCNNIVTQLKRRRSEKMVMKLKAAEDALKQERTNAATTKALLEAKTKEWELLGHEVYDCQEIIQSLEEKLKEQSSANESPGRKRAAQSDDEEDSTAKKSKTTTPEPQSISPSPTTSEAS